MSALGQGLTVTAFEQRAEREEVLFQNVSAGSRFSRCFTGLIVVVLAHDHDSRAWIAKQDFSRRCDSVYLVHFDVHQDPVRKATVICIESFGAVAAFLNFTHHVADHSSDQAAHGHVIVHN